MYNHYYTGKCEGEIISDTIDNSGLCIDNQLTSSVGWPKSNVPKVRAYCSASDHLIRKIFSGVCRDIHWFEEYLKIIEIDDHFFE